MPNGSFEEYTECPDYFSQWALVVGWSSPYTTSSDYFNGCSAGLICGVPLNTCGYQAPYHGEGYMGLATYGQGDPDYREIIATELLEPLQIGVPVCVSMKVACGGYGSDAGNSAAWKARGPGLRFFVELPTDWSTILYPNDAVIYMDTVLADTADWIDISGTYVPDSAYRFLAIANFFNDSLSWPQLLDPEGGLPGAYAFVDDVRASLDLNYCAQAVAVNDPPNSGSYIISSAVNSIMVRTTDPMSSEREIVLYNPTGQMLCRGQWPTGQAEMEMNVPVLAQGLLLLRIRGASGKSTTLRHFHFSP